MEHQPRGNANERGYTYKWQQYTKRYLQENPLCRMCQNVGKVESAELVDHIIPVKSANDPLFWEATNHQPLSVHCHGIKTNEDIRKGLTRGQPLSIEAQEHRFPSNLQRSRIPVTMVCGPPASGKSTYLKQHVGPKDVVIDLDAIMQKLSGLPEHHTDTEWFGPALEERNRQLRALATDTTHERAWFVISAPDPIERQRWAYLLGAQVVVLNTPLQECVDRILRDPSRQAFAARMIQAARHWHAQHGGAG